MDIFRSFVPIIASVISLSAVAENGERNRERIEQILSQYEPLTLSIVSKAKKHHPENGWDISICTGFLIEGTADKVATALHCIPEPKQFPGITRIVSGKIETDFIEIGYETQVEGIPAKLICSDKNSDIAVLGVKDIPRIKKAPKLYKGEVPLGTEYMSILSNNVGGFSYGIGSGKKISFPTRIYSEGMILSKGIGTIEEKSTDILIPTAVELLQTNNSPKGGFSGGPLLTKTGETIGIWTLLDGAFGGATSIKNLKSLLETEACKEAMRDN